MLSMDQDEARKQPWIKGRLAEMHEGDFDVRDLECGDFAALDAPLTLGIERKALNNLVGSVMNNEIDDQLSRMRDTYDVSVILVENFPTASPSGKLALPGRKPEYPYGLFVASMIDWFGRGIWPLFVTNQTATPWWISYIYRWCMKMEHRTSFQPKSVLPNLEKMELMERVLLAFPGIGPERASQFRDDTPALFGQRSEEEIQAMVGRKTGGNLYRLWHGSD